MKTKILIIDPDNFFVESLKYSFDEEYNIEAIFHGENIIEKITNNKYDLILMDLNLPDVNGLTLCQSIRENSNLPIIIITKRNEDINKILALEYGADDYLVKPFNILELKARIKAILRRLKLNQNNNTSQIIKYGDFEINSLGRKINKLDRRIDLTGKEFDLFYVLISNPGKIFKREELLELVWDYAYYGDLRTVDVHIRRIREKVEDNPSNPKYILTKWGLGYYYRKFNL